MYQRRQANPVASCWLSSAMTVLSTGQLGEAARGSNQAVCMHPVTVLEKGVALGVQDPGRVLCSFAKGDAEPRSWELGRRPKLLAFGVFDDWRNCSGSRDRIGTLESAEFN